ncbi:hypothetical protein PG993_012603 [Apiospora rasikravindrae]|uniref:Major facilitator superfamily (MFS) profile domain-containing protein n=1 Tax=Apiospora rasikravindrae TaxID=990691 RepID=A0ABR1S2U8_9PEZI
MNSNGQDKTESRDGVVSPEASQYVAPGPLPAKFPPPPPDGGTRAWLQVLGSWCLVFNTWGLIVTFGVYQAYYERGTLFNSSSSNISWIGALQSLMVFAVGAFVGPVYDRGYLKHLLAAGTFGLVFGHMMLSLCTQYWQVLLAQGIVVGLGGGCLFVPALAVVQPYFGARLGLALGIVGTGSSIGNIVYAVIFIRCIDTVGFAWTTRIIGFAALATLSVPLAVSQMRMKPPVIRKVLDPSAFTDGRFMLCILGCFLGYAGTQVTFFYIAFYGQANNWFTGNLALYLIPIINAGSILGRVIPNALADKVGALNVVIPGSILIGLITLCNMAVTSQAGIICIAIFFGLMSGIFISTPPLLFMILTKDKTTLGSRMGIAYTFIGLSVLVGGPPAGALLQHSPSFLDWAAAWTYAGVLPFAACVAFCALRIWLGGWKLFSKT